MRSIEGIEHEIFETGRRNGKQKQMAFRREYYGSVHFVCYSRRSMVDTVLFVQKEGVSGIAHPRKHTAVWNNRIGRGSLLHFRCPKICTGAAEHYGHNVYQKNAR